MMLPRQAKNTYSKIRNTFQQISAIEKYVTVDVQVEQNKDFFKNL